MNNNFIGQKIREYRNRAGLSQLDLEIAIEDAPGSLSRIESGKTNPTKETIIDIAKALNLNTIEISSLFGIDLLQGINQLLEESADLLSTLDLKEVLDKTVNSLVLKMGYLASAVFLVGDDGDRVYMHGLTWSNIAEKAVNCLDAPLESIYLSLSRDPFNLTVKAIKENKTYLTHHTHEYTVPMVTKDTADRIQEVTGDRSNIIYPLCVNNRPFGAIVYVKKVASDFRDERETLRLISRLIAVAIHNAGRFESLKDSNPV